MIDQPTIDDYINWLSDPSPDVRRNAAWVLGRQRDIRIVEPLIAKVADDDAGVRVRVVEALGNLKDERVVPPLIAVLQNDADAEVRAYAAQSLGNSGDSRAVEPLITAMQDSDASVRLAAGTALGIIADPRAIDPLVLALVGDTDTNVLYQVARSLTQIGGPQVVDRLLEALNTGNVIVKINIIETLGQLYDQRVVEPLTALLDDADEDIRETARWALRQLGQS